MSALFGPAGNSDSFAEKGYKSNIDAPKFVNEMGLDAYEYQCGRGVKLNPDTAKQFKLNAEKYNVKVSLHAPYYISLSSVEKEKRDNSVNYIIQSAKAVDLLGGQRIVVHSGSCSKISREQALELALNTMKNAVKALDDLGLSHIRICPETMGKINQLGTLDEVLSLCEIDERLLPCIDFGHLNARTLGGLKTKADFEAVLNEIENRLGNERLKSFHAHFSKIEYTTGGEKQHLTFADDIFGPEFDPLAELIAKKNCSPTIICESRGTQAEDALLMKEIYKGCL
ncbi:MAG: TIM barrel protein [Clostridia bacterium]|nr:TIM barrel protein [Clostridia bacterium]